MFDALGDRLQATLSDVRSRGTLTEADVDKAMREIRMALLEADVNFKVVKQFTQTVKERCLGADVLEALDPGQQVIKIVNEELAALMGGAGRDLALASKPPTVILMAGLQGSGKTTASAKLARLLAQQQKSVALAACDTQRPAAVEQLVTMGKRAGAHVYEQGTDRNPVDIAEWALHEARRDGHDVLVIDTAGRLHIDEGLMDELAAIRARVKPHNVLLVVDAMTGQDAVNVAEAFGERRRDPDQARRRRARRRRAFGQGGHGQADHVRVGRRADRATRALPPGADGHPHPRHGGRDDPDREGRAGPRRRLGRGA
jgi:signal recognition particle subunit SRP54